MTIKWGNKFTPIFANRLSNMIKMTTPNAEFLCWTDNLKGLDCDATIPEGDHPDLEHWWWKLYFFEYDTAIAINADYFMILDLDVVVQKDLNVFLQYAEDKGPTLIPNHWNGGYNSSIVIWKNGQCRYIWDHFNQDPDYFMVKYRGVDGFLKGEGLKVNTFPTDKNLYYSRMFGGPGDPGGMVGEDGKRIFYHYPDHHVCYFNQYGYEFGDEAYEGMEDYWWSKSKIRYHHSPNFFIRDDIPEGKAG